MFLRIMLDALKCAEYLDKKGLQNDNDVALCDLSTI